MEVWLKGEKDVLVGWLTDFAPFDHTITKAKIKIILKESSLEPDPFWPATDDIFIENHFRLTEKVVDRDHALTLHEGYGRGSWHQKNVPVGAKHQYFEHGNLDRYSWKVLAVDMDDYEFLFDLPTFESFEPKSKMPLTDDEFDTHDWVTRHYKPSTPFEKEWKAPWPTCGILDESTSFDPLAGVGVDLAKTDSVSTFTTSARRLSDESRDLLMRGPHIESDYLKEIQREMMKRIDTKMLRAMYFGDWDGH